MSNFIVRSQSMRGPALCLASEEKHEMQSTEKTVFEIRNCDSAQLASHVARWSDQYAPGDPGFCAPSAATWGIQEAFPLSLFGPLENWEEWFDIQKVIIKANYLPAVAGWHPTYVNFTVFSLDNNGGASISDGDNPCPTHSHTQNVNWKTIRDLENGLNKPPSPRMSVPNNHGVVIGNSGPTIGSGNDIGQFSVADLKKLNLSAHLVQELTPYAARGEGQPFTGQAAYNFVAAHPLTISQAEVAQLDTAVESAALAHLVVDFDTAAGHAGAFYEMPSEAQTVLADLSFNYKDKVEGYNIWGQFINKDWTGAINNLNNFGDPSTVNRRLSEANILNSAKNAGKLHDGSDC